jgi:hypothetical protein
LGAAASIPVDRRAAKADRGRRRPRLGRFGVIALLVAIVLLALVPAVMSTLEKTPRDKIGISYGGGPIEGEHYQKIVQPGSGLFFNGLFDTLYLYPADQQNYIISNQEGVGAVDAPDSISAPTSDRVQVQYQAAVYFKLNTDELRPFHEQLGLKFSAYTDDGWDQMLQDTFRPQIENALQQETRKVEVADLVGNAASKML